MKPIRNLASGRTSFTPAREGVDEDVDLGNRDGADGAEGAGLRHRRGEHAGEIGRLVVPGAEGAGIVAGRAARGAHREASVGIIRRDLPRLGLDRIGFADDELVARLGILRAWRADSRCRSAFGEGVLDHPSLSAARSASCRREFQAFSTGEAMDARDLQLLGGEGARRGERERAGGRRDQESAARNGSGHDCSPLVRLCAASWRAGRPVFSKAVKLHRLPSKLSSPAAVHPPLTHRRPQLGRNHARAGPLAKASSGE